MTKIYKIVFFYFLFFIFFHKSLNAQTFSFEIPLNYNKKKSNINPQDIENIKLLGNKDTPKELLISYIPGNENFIKDIFSILKNINSERTLFNKELIKLRVLNLNKSSLYHIFEKSIPKEEFFCSKKRSLNSIDDIWMRDIFKLASVKIKGKKERELLIFDTNREREGGKIPSKLKKIWKIPYILNINTPSINGNYGGNIDVTPNGILYLGSTVSSDMFDFWVTKGYSGKFLVIPTHWLRVGHVDEMLNILNYSKDPLCPMTILKADPQLALDLVLKNKKKNSFYLKKHSLSPKNKTYVNQFHSVLKFSEDLYPYLKKNSSGHYFIDKNDYRDIHYYPFIKWLPRFLKHNEIISQYIDSSAEMLRDKIIKKNPECRSIKIISAPVLYLCNPSYSSPFQCDSILPNLVNMLILDKDLIIPAPHYSPFKKNLRETLEGMDLGAYFIREDSYHERSGEIHCATNELRSLH